MNWKKFREKCKQLDLQVGKTWVCTGSRDYTKHHKIVYCWDEGYSREVIAVNISYEVMYEIITLRIEAKKREKQLLSGVYIYNDKPQ